MIRNHMYTRLYQAPCQLCLTTSLLATDGISHEGPRFFTLVQPWRTSISLTYISPLHFPKSNFYSQYQHQDLQQPTSIVDLTAEVPVPCPVLLSQSMQSLIASLAVLAFYYSQNKTNFHKTQFFLHSFDGCLAFSIDSSFQTMKFAKRRCENSMSNLNPPSSRPCWFCLSPLHIFHVGCCYRGNPACGKTLQLLSAIVPSGREFIFWSEHKLKENVDLRRSNPHFSQCYWECLRWLEAARLISRLHGRIAVCMKRLLQRTFIVFCQTCTNGIVVHFHFILVVHFLLCLLIFLNHKLTFFFT